jgi:hypothetical protein
MPSLCTLCKAASHACTHLLAPNTSGCSAATSEAWPASSISTAHRHKTQHSMHSTWPSAAKREPGQRQRRCDTRQPMPHWRWRRRCRLPVHSVPKAGRQGSTPVWKGALLADCWNTLRCSRAGRRGQRQGDCVGAPAAGCGASAAQEIGSVYTCWHAPIHGNRSSRSSNSTSSNSTSGTAHLRAAEGCEHHFCLRQEGGLDALLLLQARRRRGSRPGQCRPSRAWAGNMATWRQLSERCTTPKQFLLLRRRQPPARARCMPCPALPCTALPCPCSPSPSPLPRV